MSLNLTTILRTSARANPGRPAMVLGEATVTYGQLYGMAERFAGALRGLGLKPGEHVALLLPNVPQFTVAYFGAHLAGNPVVPLNVLLSADEIAYHLEDADVAVLVVWEGFAANALEACRRTASCRHIVVATAAPGAEPPAGTLGFGALLAGATPLTDPHASSPDDTAVILYTSGTTGRPKGAELTHFNLYHNAEYVRTRLLTLSDNTVALGVLPLFHSFGQTVNQNAVLGAGGTLVLLPRFDAAAAAGLIQKHRVNLLAAVPTMYFGLLHMPDADRFDLSSLRFCVSGGAPMPVEVMRAFDAKYNVNILEGYGLSETSPVASFNVLDRPKKPGTIGLPLLGVELRLVDDDFVEVPAGQPGEIAIKGPNVMKGYYKRVEATTQVLRDGWFRTGDVGTIDADGYYTIVDRKKDMILRGGFNVYPREVEEVLYAHPAVAEAAVIGVPDEALGEEVKAVVAFKPGKSATPEELVAYCKQHVAAYKYPRTVEIRDALPKGPTGKILKRELR